MAIKDLDPAMREKLIERIQALFALGDKSRNDNDNEAEVAMQKAQELLQKYNISMSEVEVTKEEIKEEIIDGIARESKKSTVSTWEGTLLATVGLATETKPYREQCTHKVTGRTFYRMRLIGALWDVAVGVELYKFLHSKLQGQANRKYGSDYSSQTSYLTGAVGRLNERVKEQNERMNKEQADNNKFALMVVNKKDAIEQYMGKVGLILRPHKSRHLNWGGNDEAFMQGRADADKIDLGTENRLQGK